MKNKNKVVGIDVSKDTLDVCYVNSSGEEVQIRVSNNQQGFAHLLKRTGKRYWFVMETSGPYYLRLAYFLKAKGAHVKVENALLVKRYIQMHNERNKSDRKDAQWICRYGSDRPLVDWEVPSRVRQECHQKLSALDCYTRQRTMLLNQLHSIEELPVMDKVVVSGLKSMILKIESIIEKTEKELYRQVEGWSKEQMENLQSIPGMGKRTAAMLIVFTDGFTRVENYRQLIALSGLSPKEFSSGSSVRARVRICKRGGSRIRKLLYMCSMSAIKKNKACRELYERLIAKGKNGKLALIAVCNKLLKQAFA